MKKAIKIAFWGLGSIAARHIKNIAKVLENRGIIYEIDVFRHVGKPITDEVLNRLIHRIYAEDELESNHVVYDLFFITNPTSLHYESIKRCIPYANHMFIEKPVFASWKEDVLDLGLKDNSIYYVACPLRYTSVLQYIKRNIDMRKTYSVRVISSSYLPEWRENQDYRKTYSAHKKLGGGVSIDLIHEWDYLIQFFGLPKKSLYAGGKFSNLQIDSDDLATYIGIYDDKLIELHLDYFGRKTVRECCLFMDEDTVVADFVKCQVRFLKSGKIVELKEDRNNFQIREIEHFLDIVDGKINNDSTIQHAINVLRIATDHKEER